ncbi:MAG: flagellar basal-body rod protein FlgF [Alphaproteobacteria bacterium]|nr:flagellar basal-body rod protein FlgF [Alphaproteobacteria bacterium]
MENTLYVGLTHQIGLRRWLDVTANNIANINTDGFRGDRIAFNELLEKPEKTRAISFSEAVNITPNPTEGPLQQTGNPLDFAIQGNGYFAVDTPAGVQYTRAGRFTLNLNNDLITNHGYQVLDDNNQALTLPANYERIDVTAEGLIVADGVAVGRIGVFDFDNPASLSKNGDTLFISRDPAIRRQNALLKQGYVEGSNVQAITELVKMMQVERDNARIKSLIDRENQLSTEAINVFTRIS